MKLLIIRHGDPDYTIDSLTPRGEIEAQQLADMLEKCTPDVCYVSPMGRARKTASYTLERLHQQAEICDWLREFQGRCIKGRANTEPEYCWDWLPADWTAIPEFYDRKEWLNVPAVRDTNIPEEYEYVTKGLDGLLARHGYVHTGGYFTAVDPNEDTVALFCHFGVECVLLSHILSVSPMPLWMGTCARTSSVTTLVTEEREDGIAAFRILEFASTAHLYVNGTEPSFQARFCEMYSNADQRH